jgi:LPXTG-motif cell wall-anchored protein
MTPTPTPDPNLIYLTDGTVDPCSINGVSHFTYALGYNPDALNGATSAYVVSCHVPLPELVPPATSAPVVAVAAPPATLPHTGPNETIGALASILLVLGLGLARIGRRV